MNASKLPMMNTLLPTILSLVVVVACTATSGSARAQTVSDDFESGHAAWWFDGQGVRGGVWTQRGPRHVAELWFRDESSWSSVARLITVPGFSWYAPDYCQTQFHVMPKLQAADGSTWYPRVTITVEVIDPESWSYIAVRTINLPTLNAFYPVSTLEWQPWTPEAVVRVSISGAGAWQVFVDDMTTSCHGR
jgi:hypothetical protein